MAPTEGWPTEAPTSPLTSSVTTSRSTHRSRSLSAIRARIGARLSRSREYRRNEMQVPERFRSDEEEDEEEDDNIANHNLGGGIAVQSFYSVIAQAQGKGKITRAFQKAVTEEGDDDDEEEELEHTSSLSTFARQTLPPRREDGSSVAQLSSDASSTASHSQRPARPAQDEVDMMAQSQILPPPTAAAQPASRSTATRVSPSRLTAMDRRLQAKAKLDTESSTSTIPGEKKPAVDESTDTSTKTNVDIDQALVDIFSFDEPEQLISEYPCWYLQNVLVQGYMYITQRHICFFAYIQKKSNMPTKTGHLSKQGKRNPRFSRYWFALKGDVLSYYANAADPYFPSGAIDLRRGISAEVVLEKGKDRQSTTLFDITTDYRTYHFRADSPTSAKEWVKQLQKVIFRSHNDGDSVKISVPLASVLDVESSPVIDFAETIRIRAIDEEDTFSVEEYCFTFFQSGQEALQTLNSMVTLRAGPALSDRLDDRGRRSTSTLIEPVRSTVTSRSRTRSPSRHQRTHQSTASRRFIRPAAPGSTIFSDSSVSSTGLDADSQSASSLADDDEDISADPMSASQFLSGDRAFRSPTLRNRHQSTAQSAAQTINAEQKTVSYASNSPTTNTSIPPSRTISTETTASMHESQILEPIPKQPTTARSGGVLTGSLQQAFGLADRVRSQGKRMSLYIGSSPRDYYSKITGAIRGGKKHYSEAEGLATEDRYEDADELLDNIEHERRFHEHFALPESEKLLAVYYCWLYRVLPLYGKIYVGTSRLCFRSLLYGTRTKLNLPYQDVDNLQKERGIRWGYPGMVVVIRGHEELFFDFAEQGIRDDCVVTILRQKEDAPAMEDSMIMTEEEKIDAQVAAAEHELLLGARRDDHAAGADIPLHLDPSNPDVPPILFDDSTASVLDIRPQQSMRITCLTIGSRGDVQPYVALCKGLLAEGHRPRIATHAEFGPFVTKHGIDFVAVEGDPAELMRICVEYGMFTPSFLYEVNSKFRGWLDRLLDSAYEACKGSDLLIESPSAMGGIHIAEALQIPYFRAFTMPWTRTRAYPHAFAVPNKKMGGQYNYMTYFLFDNMFWKVTAGQINRWRSKVLGLGATSLEKLQPNKVPFLYNFSPTVVPPPLDFSDWVRVTGYWFLDEANQWTPPADLQAFIKKARDDKAKLVYIGFGSVVVSDSRLLTEQVVGAVQKADVRCILSKGWSDRLATKNNDREAPLPDYVFRINAAPHDWLFRQVDAIVHHGGAGTTGASLRAGVPTIIKPFFGDQFFFATRVEDLGVGIFLKKITVNGLGKALWIATHDDRMMTKASILGEQIDREDGVGTAIKAIYRDLEYARSLIKKRDMLSLESSNTRKSVEEETCLPESDAMDEEEEESWTFVESESDVDITAARSRANSYAPMLLPNLSTTRSGSGAAAFASGMNSFAGPAKR